MKFKNLIFTSKILVLSLMLVLNFVVHSNAQSGTSSVRGTVTDPQGNAIAGANITLKIESKNFTRTQISNGDGQYVFTAVPPDNYNLEVEANGFKKTTVQNIQALVDTPQTADVALELGQVTESVTVSTSNEAVINTTNGSIGNTITTQQIIQLPLSARNTPDLLSLQPGVTPDNGTGNGGAVNGGRSDQGNITLDGVDVNEQQGGDGISD
jgi:ABC-type Na+ efflux pump permease subunit